MLVKNKKKIVFISKNQDLSTNKIIDWLISRDKENLVRLNYKEEIDINYLQVTPKDGLEFGYSNKKGIEIAECDTLFYRTGDLSVCESMKINRAFSKYYANEAKTLNRNIYFSLGQKKKVSSFYNEVENSKLIDLYTANNVGLNIPATLITSSGDTLEEFIFKYRRVVAKPIKDIIPVNSNSGEFYALNQHFFELGQVKNLKNKSFFPLIFQEYIEKKFEVRAFIFNDRIFAMAIFSQRNEQTKNDYRSYDKVKPNRNVPINLPNKIEQQILSFCKLSNLNTCSIDLIFSKKGRFYFLESNPSGQFDWLSTSCNYYIEEYIANQL